MKVASISTRAAVGAAVRASRIKVTENLDAPLLMVAAVRPSALTARPKGLGACTPTSVPAGVRKRPLGRMAPERPSTVVARAVGRSAAGARKFRKRERASSWRSAEVWRTIVSPPSTGRRSQATAALSATTSTTAFRSSVFLE